MNILALALAALLATQTPSDVDKLKAELEKQRSHNTDLQRQLDSAHTLLHKRDLSRIAQHLEKAYAAFERKQFEACVQQCEEVLKLDAGISVARELKDDARLVIERPELFTLLAPKVEAWKKATDSEQGMIPAGKGSLVQPPAPRTAVAAALAQLAAAQKVTAVVGKVTAVAGEIGLVVLSVGIDDGVRVGGEFTVYRGGDFVAKVVVDRADRKWSAAKVVLKKQDPRVADDVSNALSEPKAPAVPLSPKAGAELLALRKELDEVRNQVRQLTDRLVPSYQGPGVSVEEAPEPLRDHLGILRGLLVRRVREGSAAEKAGLKANDVIPDLLEAQLVEAVESGKPIEIVRQGAKMRLKGR